MKKYRVVLIIFALISGTTLFSSCAGHEAKSQSLEDFRAYVDNLSNKTKDNWEEIQEKYNEKEDAVESDLSTMTTDSKAEFKELQDKFAKFKEEAKEKQDAAADKVGEMAEDAKNSISYHLLSIVKGDDGDTNLSAVNASNIAGVYDNFVSYIADNKGNFKESDWNEATKIYDALDKRKDQLKDISTKDNMSIAKSKTRYAAIKTAAKVNEKVDEVVNKK